MNRKTAVKDQDFLAFLAEIKGNDEFRRIEVSPPDGNILIYTGVVIGEDIGAKFDEIAGKYGFVALAQELSMWFTEELYQKYKDCL